MPATRIYPMHSFSNIAKERAWEKSATICLNKEAKHFWKIGNYRGEFFLKDIPYRIHQGALDCFLAVSGVSSSDNIPGILSFVLILCSDGRTEEIWKGFDPFPYDDDPKSLRRAAQSFLKNLSQVPLSENLFPICGWRTLQEGAYK